MPGSLAAINRLAERDRATSSRRDLEPAYVGAGRSGLVYRTRANNGSHRIARKVFFADGVTRLLQRVVLGAPNPYVWDEHAIRCAVLRRQILAPLVEWWLPGRLRVARAAGYAWNAQHEAFELHAEFVEGRVARLRSQPTDRQDDEYTELVDHVMKPLQRRLLEAGFDGSTWQAGLGNPQATSNFLLAPIGSASPTGNTPPADLSQAHIWVWIDIESGVPNILPLSPPTFVRYVLPRTIRHRRPLFDDIDGARLLSYLDRHGRSLIDHLGIDGYCALIDRVDLLRFHQDAWRGPRRKERQRRFRAHQERSSLGDTIDRGAGGDSAKAAPPLPARPCRPIAPAPRLRDRLDLTARSIRDFARWPDLRVAARTEIACEWIAARILAWQERGQLSGGAAAGLARSLTAGRDRGFVSDLGFVLALGPFSRRATAIGVGCLLGTGQIMGAIGGAALGLATLPSLGLFAAVLRTLRSDRRSADEDAVARFVLYETGARVGRAIPIVGGPDSALEHRCNRLADELARCARALRSSPPHDPSNRAAAD